MSDISVGDGFRFGCGFMLAAAIVWLALAIFGGILMAIFGAAFSGIIEKMQLLSLVPQLLAML